MQNAIEFFGEEKITLFHGSPVAVPLPEYGKGNTRNDYGRGFYCTELEHLACEWACPTDCDGVVNEYLFDCEDLRVIDLESENFSVLNWLAVLVEHRAIGGLHQIGKEMQELLLRRYAVNLSGADIVYGYRADDSYYSFARAFLNNSISLESLEESLFLGGLGYQVAIMSKKGFDHINYVSSRVVEGSVWSPRRMQRDALARETFHRIQSEQGLDGTFARDILKEG